MAKQSGAQKEVIDRVMHEFKEGELRSNGGGKVRNPKQAIAIALSESGTSNRVSPARNRRNLSRTREDETRAGLYARAQQKGIAGRSKMSKEQLREALGRAS